MQKRREKQRGERFIYKARDGTGLGQRKHDVRNRRTERRPRVV